MSKLSSWKVGDKFKAFIGVALGLDMFYQCLKREKKIVIKTVCTRYTRTLILNVYLKSVFSPKVSLLKTRKFVLFDHLGNVASVWL